MGSVIDKPYLLIIDDEPNFSESLQYALEDSFIISKAGTLAAARRLLSEKMPDAMLLDIRLSDGSGIDFLREIKDIPGRPVVIVMTAYAAVDNAVTALKEGAVDYFTKPVDIEKLKRELGVCLENRSLQKKVIALKTEIKKYNPPFITSGAGRMKEIVKMVPVIAPLNIPVLINGETGTGKERLAKWIHDLSGLRGEMVSINCSALPKDIIESELFGHTKGAFSGALAYKEGLIEQAEGGTLFLDEIGELPEGVQAKFLRLLEEGVYYKIGETRERKVNFRLISATNKVLTDPASSFRPDLFFRINGFSFDLPLLKDRKEDVPLLVSAFLEEANRDYRKSVKSVSREAIEYFMRHDWPGNIRELKWAIHRAVAVASRDSLDIEDVSLASSEFREPKAGGKAAPEHSDYSVPFHEAMEGLEKKYIEHALALANNNKTEAAMMLGLSVRVLHYKLKQYNLRQPSKS
ncbi:MAG: sigma-54-dependent Fis family transcriptional regulator [Deltaproteobacteria bacterium]|nr:sigma-54-dependent Fis family transcriptional regulator [Deltaproteobacteria bacterium]